MFIKLLNYNRKLFLHSFSVTKFFVLFIYSVLVALIFSQIIGSVFVIITLQSSELSEMYEWFTPVRGTFILLAFVNILWFTQFFFTNTRLLNLQENRKLLAMGFPLQKLSRYLSVLAFFHPLNLLFSLSWFILLILYFGSLYFVPLALALVFLNSSVIFFIKFRILSLIKDYQKWLMVLAIGIIIVFSSTLSDVLSTAFFSAFGDYIASINTVLSYLPGGLLISISSSVPAVNAALVVLCGFFLYYLQKDNIKNTRKALQHSVTSDSSKSLRTYRFRKWLCEWFGNHAGKYLYYATSHPYNRIYGLFIILFPVLYMPSILSGPPEQGESLKFFILFFFMYMPIGFQLMLLANMFGYEHRELLRDLQFPVLVKNQIQERFLGALFLPLILLIIASFLEIFLLGSGENILTILLGNLLIFEVFTALFLWSTFNHYKKVKWVSFSFTSPVISQSVAITCGLLMVALGAAIFIPYGTFEIYKQLALLVLVPWIGYKIYRYVNNIQQAFLSKIMPRLWTEL